VNYTLERVNVLNSILQNRRTKAFPVYWHRCSITLACTKRLILQETAASKRVATEEQHQRMVEDISKALQLAEAAASMTSLDALSDTVGKLEAGMPSREELANVQGQLASLQNGMAALEALSDMRNQVPRSVSCASHLIVQHFLPST
jgi:hypothetical protein